jgi:hypothetical protein
MVNLMHEKKGSVISPRMHHIEMQVCLVCLPEFEQNLDQLTLEDATATQVEGNLMVAYGFMEMYSVDGYQDSTDIAQRLAVKILFVHRQTGEGEGR